jgi:tellurite resistance protein
MLIGTHVATITAVAGAALVLVAIAAGCAFAAWMLAHWLRGAATMEAVHGGFLLPTVALGFVGAYSAAAVHLTPLAFALLAIGGFFWIVMVTIVFARHLVVAALPEALTPTLMILLAPPVVAGLAWFTINGRQVDGPALAIAGLAGLIVLVQIALVPAYRRLPFSIGFWSFTFPIAAAAVYGIEWLAILTPPAWQFGAWLLVAAVTGFIAAMGARSLRSAALAARERRPGSRALVTGG